MTLHHTFIWYIDTVAKENNVHDMLLWIGNPGAADYRKSIYGSTIDDPMTIDYRRAVRGNTGAGAFVEYYFIVLEVPEMETIFRLRFG